MRAWTKMGGAPESECCSLAASFDFLLSIPPLAYRPGCQMKDNGDDRHEDKTHRAANAVVRESTHNDTTFFLFIVLTCPSQRTADPAWQLPRWRLSMCP